MIRQMTIRVAMLLTAFIFSSLLFTISAQNRANILKVYNWADYLDLDLIEEFQDWYKEQTGEEVKVVYQTFDINENMLTEIEVGHEDYDVVCPSEYIIERMLKRNLLQKINISYFAKTNTPNYLDNVSPWAEAMFQEMAADAKQNVKEYTVGYMWGTTGFLYNRKYVKDGEVQSWAALLNPRFKNQLYMKDAFRDVYSVLIQFAKADEIEKGTVNRQDLAVNLTDENILAVEDVLIQAKPQIAGWEADFGKERMCQGKVWLNATWSGDAQWAIDEEEDGVDLAYVVPKEGSNAWFDGWVIPIYAKNPKAASYWINFLCMEENAVRNMDETGYVSVIATPYVLEEMEDEECDYLDASYFFGEDAKHVRLNHVYYPDISVINRCVLMHDTADRNEAMLEMWSRVKGNNLNWKMLTFVIAVLSIIIYSIIYRKVKRYRRRKNRQKRLQSLKKQ
ncbi:MAG: ABC transporter substrate-binding protein [Prevotellaceae bacterium]|nr:ABC transporter substrate-binding protein [Candidatus Minthosoma caballi]